MRFVAVTGGGAPTGLVEYFGAKFLITKNRNTLPSMFITVTEAGTINAWNNVVDPLNAQITFSDASRVSKVAIFLRICYMLLTSVVVSLMFSTPIGTWFITLSTHLSQLSAMLLIMFQLLNDLLYVLCLTRLHKNTMHLLPWCSLC